MNEHQAGGLNIRIRNHKLTESIFVGVITAFVSKIGEKMTSQSYAQWIWQSFVIELWPIWIGLIVGGLYWFIRDYQSTRQLAREANIPDWAKEILKIAEQKKS